MLGPFWFWLLLFNLVALAVTSCVGFNTCVATAHWKDYLKVAEKLEEDIKKMRKLAKSQT